MWRDFSANEVPIMAPGICGNVFRIGVPGSIAHEAADAEVEAAFLRTDGFLFSLAPEMLI